MKVTQLPKVTLVRKEQAQLLDVLDAFFSFCWVYSAVSGSGIRRALTYLFLQAGAPKCLRSSTVALKCHFDNLLPPVPVRLSEGSKRA